MIDLLRCNSLPRFMVFARELVLFSYLVVHIQESQLWLDFQSGKQPPSLEDSRHAASSKLSVEMNTRSDNGLSALAQSSHGATNRERSIIVDPNSQDAAQPDSAASPHSPSSPGARSKHGQIPRESKASRGSGHISTIGTPWQPAGPSSRASLSPVHADTKGAVRAGPDEPIARTFSQRESKEAGAAPGKSDATAISGQVAKAGQADGSPAAPQSPSAVKSAAMPMSPTERLRPSWAQNW